VLLEEEAATATGTVSIMDSKNTDNTGMAGVLEKEELKFTYQEDREEISSLASISSLAGYNTKDKGLIDKLSEIKTSTVEDQKPRSISLLQQALAAVTLLSIVAAVAMLIIASVKNRTFQANLQLMDDAKLAVIKYQNMQILTRELVNLANGDSSEFTLFPLQPVDTEYNLSTNGTALFLQSYLLQQAELFRKLYLKVDDPSLKSSFDYAQMNQQFKDSPINLTYVRIDGQVYQNQMSTMLSIYELLTILQDIGQLPTSRSAALPRSALNGQPGTLSVD